MQAHDLGNLCQSKDFLVRVVTTHVDVLQLDPWSEDVGDTVFVYQVHPTCLEEEGNEAGCFVELVVTWRQVTCPRVAGQVYTNLISIGQVSVVSLQRNRNGMLFQIRQIGAVQHTVHLFHILIRIVWILVDFLKIRTRSVHHQPCTGQCYTQYIFHLYFHILLD